MTTAPRHTDRIEHINRVELRVRLDSLSRTIEIAPNCGATRFVDSANREAIA